MLHLSERFRLSPRIKAIDSHQAALFLEGIPAGGCGGYAFCTGIDDGLTSFLSAHTGTNPHVAQTTVCRLSLRIVGSAYDGAALDVAFTVAAGSTA